MAKKKKQPTKKKAKKVAKKIAPIIWKSKDVPVTEIAFTPNNYKIKTELGKERLQTSLSKFGRAGSVVVNPFSPADMKKLGVPNIKGKKYILIDGNSRLEETIENGHKTISISYPAKPLIIAQFKEMSAMFDFAVAGEVDMDRINGELGSTKDFYAAWGIEPDMAERVANMGANAKISEELEYAEEGDGKKAGKKGKAPETQDTRMVQAFFTSAQEEKFREMEMKLVKSFNVTNTTDVIYKSVEFAFKNKK